MTQTAFYQNLRRGLGSAIIELMESPDRSKYRDIILRCCLRDISYDWQVEGTKGHYLYSAICALGDIDYFENILIHKFLSRCTDKLFHQLEDILFCYANNGSEPAKEAFRAKYNYFALKNGRLSNTHSLDEGHQWDSVARRLFSIDGFAAFQRHALDVGALLHRNPKQCHLYDCDYFISEAEDKFGKKRTNGFLDRMYDKSDAVKALIDTRKAEALSHKRHEENAKQKKITLEVLLRTAREAATSELKHYGSIMQFRWSFMKEASDDEIMELVSAILHEPDETAKGLLLRIFWRKQFPLGAPILLEYAQSSNQVLSESALALLGEFKDKTIHALAVTLLNEKGFDSLALGLLKKNYRKTDDAIIDKLMKKTSRIPHHVQMDIRGIYMHHRSPNALPILLRVYQKGDCPFCRCGIVKAMKHCGVLSDRILEECLYDSYDETRNMAMRIKQSSRGLPG